MPTDDVVRTLTPRQVRVLSLLSNGQSNAEIAEGLEIGLVEVKADVRALYRRTGVERRSQLIAWGARHGFLLPA